MRMTRRDFLKLAASVGAAATVNFSCLEKALAGNADPRVIWLQGQGCSGCSISLLNSVNLTTVDDLLINKINMEYNSTLIASAGDVALSNITKHPSESELAAFGNEWLSASDTLEFDFNKDGVVNFIDFSSLAKQGYILVVEGAIPIGADGKFCEVGGGMTMVEAFETFSSRASHIVAIGTCASFGGIPHANPNPTNSMGVSDALELIGISKPLINIPGCPAHPDWFVGTVLKLLSGLTIELDAHNRPIDYFRSKIHGNCPFRYANDADALGQAGCLENLGCKGKMTYANCALLKWNSPGQGQDGVNWCIGAKTPCNGCTEPGFPDSMTPFFK